jgi:Resolvase, N terminal domain
MLSSMLTIGYIRVASADRHAAQCASVEAQAQAICDRAAGEHADLELITDIAESAGNMNRPGLQRMLSLIAEGIAGQLSQDPHPFLALFLELDGGTLSLPSLAGLPRLS